jgi:hypothetical protein
VNQIPAMLVDGSTRFGNVTQAGYWISGWSPTARKTDTGRWLLSVMSVHRVLLELPGME